MKKNKLSIFWFVLGFSIASAVGVYAAKVVLPVTSQTPQAIAGADDQGNMVLIKVNPVGGGIVVQDAFGTVKHGTITITGDGATDRVQGPNVVANSCTFKARFNNADRIYIGGSTVTNSSGASQGTDLAIGEPLSNVTMTNLNTYYFAADSANDKISYICN